MIIRGKGRAEISTPSISVIMPVYNAQDKLKRAVSSILNQSTADFELILVDDGSTDNSNEIAKDLCKVEPRIRLLEQKNSGICAARNAGLDVATGRYVTFCDDDDELLPEALSTQLRLVQETGVDVVRTGYRLLRETSQNGFLELHHKTGEACRYVKGKAGTYGVFLRKTGPQFVWNALYKRERLSDVRFPVQCKNGLEDFIFNAKVYEKIETAVYDPFVGYMHYESQQSTSSCRNTDQVMKRVENIPLWVEAEHEAATHCCGEQDLRCVWNDRKAMFVTFLMHQLRDTGIKGTQCREAWKCLRSALNRYEAPTLDICGLKGQNIKQVMALTLYTLHLQDVYRVLSNREGK